MNWLTSRLIPEWKSAWKFASVQLAALAGAFSFVITTNKDYALSLLGLLPHDGPTRTICGLLIGLGVFVIPAFARTWKQGG